MMLSVDSIELVDRTSLPPHVRAIVTRKKREVFLRRMVQPMKTASPWNWSSASYRATSVRPDGLEIVELRITPITTSTGSALLLGRNHDPHRGDSDFGPVRG